MPTIVTEGLTKHYGDHVALDGLSLTVEEGAIFGFLGPNGSGKTTTIRLLLGLLKPTSGRASVFGRDIWRESDRIKADVGYISGDFRLYPWMNTHKALRFISGARGRMLTTVGLILAEKFGLDPDVRVRNMSRGMRQKLGLILALAHDPKLLVLDEPTTTLDPLMQQALYDHLREVTEDGATVFFSSHALSEVEQLCDRVAIIRDGRLVANDSLDTLRERAQRIVTLQWKADAPNEPPPFLELEERRDATWVCSLTGSVEDLLRWAAVQHLDDMTLGAPDLDRLFRSFYED